MCCIKKPRVKVKVELGLTFKCTPSIDCLYFISVCKFTCVHVVVQFYPWFKFHFPWFIGMVMHDNEFKTKESKI